MKTKRLIPFVSLFVSLFASILATQLFPGIQGGTLRQAAESSEASEIIRYIPAADEVPGFSATSEPEVVQGDDLFLLINGGAEVYHEYGFKQAAAVGFRHKAVKSLQFNLEIYEMNSPEAAYGVYSFKTGDNGTVLKVGNDGLLEDYYINFWKGNILVTITGFDSKKETVDAIITAARVIDARITSSGMKPSLVNVLPTGEGFPLKPNGTVYIKGMLALFNHFSFESKDIFKVKRGVIGIYEGFKLLVLEYESEAQSKNQMEIARSYIKKNPKFTFPSLETGQPDGAFWMRDGKGKHHYFALIGKYIILYRGAPPRQPKKFFQKINLPLTSPPSSKQ
jgi:hypothetical protein